MENLTNRNLFQIKDNLIGGNNFENFQDSKQMFSSLNKFLNSTQNKNCSFEEKIELFRKNNKTMCIDLKDDNQLDILKKYEEMFQWFNLKKE